MRRAGTATPMAVAAADTATSATSAADTGDLPRLCERTLPHAPPGVLRPSYVRTSTRIGTLHFGPGAFHRAHQAFYFDRLLERDADRAICAISLRTPSARDALEPQDGLYTLSELTVTQSVRVVGAIREVLVAAEDPTAVSRRLAAPDTSIVTITVTEKGYCLDGAGNLDFEHPDIVHDLRTSQAPRSLVGWLARGLQLRHELGLAPFVVLSCDNLSDNGHLLQRAVLAFAARRGRILADWIEARARFPCTMVDSITPATDAPLRMRVAHALGLHDAWPVQREPFVQWVVEETDAQGQPDWDAIGVTLSRDISVYGQAKLRLLNGAHSTLAYLGLLAGLHTVAQAMAEPALGTFVERLMIEDIQPTLAAQRGEQLADYTKSILQRFKNPVLQHRLAQIAWDGSQKLPIRIFGTLADAIRDRRPLTRLVLPIAAWMHFIRNRAGNAEPIVDPLHEQLSACGRRSSGDSRHDLALFLEIPGVFPTSLARHAEFLGTLGAAYDLIAQCGTLAAVAQLLARAQP
ncbi:MAG TPA: mannitol dehydrogenase family protein [Steroidobacteraceae bacterium]